jgi:pimeloyl-ACP methyl ester carboxylesterase
MLTFRAALHACLLANPPLVYEWAHVQLRPQVWIRTHIVSYDDAFPVYVYVNGGLGTPLLSYWDPVARQLARHFTVLAADYRGVDAFNGTAPSASMAEHRADVEALVAYARRRFRAEKVFLGGLSWGANVALNLSYAHPEWYHALSVTGPMVAFEELADVHTAANRAFCHTVKARLPWYLWPLRFAMTPCDADELVPNYWRDIFVTSQLSVPLCVLIKCTPPKWDMGMNAFSMMAEPWYGLLGTARIGLSNANAIITANHMYDLFVALQPLALPVQVVVGAEDPMVVPVVAQHFFEHLAAPSKEMHVVADSAHMVPVERTAQWVELQARLKDFAGCSA